MRTFGNTRQARRFMPLLALIATLVTMGGCGWLRPREQPVAEQIRELIGSIDISRPQTLYAAERVIDLGPAAVPVLLQILNERTPPSQNPANDVVARWVAAYALNNLASETSLDPASLIDGLEDPDPSIRVLVAATIVGLTTTSGLDTTHAPSKAIAVLREALTSSDILAFSLPPLRLSDFAASILTFQSSTPPNSASRHELTRTTT